jgi:hypothetical protein
MFVEINAEIVATMKELFHVFLIHSGKKNYSEIDISSDIKYKRNSCLTSDP